MIVMTTIETTLKEIRARTAADRAEYAGTQVDRSVLDREYLLDLLEYKM
jgi:hypothetical protein